MSVTITTSVSGEEKEYVLEFTKKTIKETERAGFKITSYADNMMTMLPILFRGAFLANSPNITSATTEEIWSDLDDKTAFVEVLMQLYNEPFEAFLEEPKKSKSSWKASK